MRSIFFALVIINIFVFAVQWFTRAPDVMKAPPAAAVRASADTSLQLLSESGVGGGADSKKNINEKKSSTALQSVVTTEASSMCTMVGPYAQLLQAEYAVERLGAMDIAAEIKSVEVPEGYSYWVYLSPEISEKEALRRLYEIQAKNIDSYRIPSGELMNGISFGMYNEKILAQARLDEVRALGYEVNLREVARTHAETWIALAPGEAEKIDATVWVDLLNRQQGLEKRQNYCLGVAPK